MPAVLALLAFHFLPLAFGGYYAFTDWNGLTHAHWIGLGNFRELARDPIARHALWHTLELAGSFVVIVNVVGLTLAMGLNRAVKSRNVLRALFFAPVVVSPLAVGYIWEYVLDYQGALNRVLRDVGLGSLQHAWLADPSSALWMILVVMVWQYSGLAMVIYLAGLQAVPDEIYEASLIDGASTWLCIRRVILPQLAPAMTISATLTLIYGLRVFDQVMALTGGGPVDASETLATQVYKQTFYVGRFGYGAALALVMTVLIGLFAFAQLILLRRREARM